MKRAIPIHLALIVGLLAGCAGLDAGSIPVVESAPDPDPLPAPPAGGYAWEDLAQRAAARSGEAKALLLDALAERRQVAVDTAWQAPQLRVGIGSGDVDEETPGRLATRTDPLWPAALPEARMLPRQWETQSSDGTEAGVRLFIANPFVNAWLRQGGAAAALAKEAESRETAFAVHGEVRALCLEAAALREEIRLLETVSALRSDLRDVRSRQAAAGASDALELIESVARAAAARSAVREKEADYRRIVRQISVLADVPAEQVRLRAFADEAMPDAAEWEVDELVELALARRPDLERARRELEAATHGVRAAQAGLVPWLDHVEGTYRQEDEQAVAYEDYTTGADRSERSGTEWQVRLAVNVPIFGWDGKEVRLAQAQQAASDVRAQALRASVRAEVAGVFGDYERACAERDALATENRKVLAVMESKLEALADEPAVGQDDLLATREAVAAYGLATFRAERECRRLALWLETASGGPLMRP